MFMLITRKVYEKLYRLRRFPISGLLVVSVLSLTSRINPAIGQSSAKDQIASEIQRFEQSPAAKTADASDDLAALRQSRSTLESGLIFASLYQLKSPFTDLAMQQYLGSKSDVKEMDAFEKEWRRIGAELTTEESALTDAKLRALPSAVRAIVESNQLQSRTLYEAGHLYGRETGVPNGLAYNGLAKGLMDFAVWAAELKFPSSPGSPAPSARNGISELEKEVLQAYNKPGAAEQQGRFNQINSTLKFAAELDHAGKNDGALQQLLSASLTFGGLSAAAAGQNDAGELQKQLLKFKGRFAENSSDPSIGEMYWEILTASASSKTPATGAKRAAIIVDDVLPRYFRATTPGESATATAVAPTGAKVTITLVRWPYT